ncbi:MAG TPA: DNA-protecting protein DprA [Lachnospiraceae bacterium]|nr:DNA-protecting protein DprA [Lachnospiraceae bacterium]
MTGGQNMSMEKFIEANKGAGKPDVLKKIYESMIGGELRQEGVKYVYYDDPAYPSRLRDLSDPPKGLFYRGNLPREDRLSVAVIGSRECTDLGSDMAIILGGLLAKNGFQVISGLARGIDGIAQRSACMNKGATFGVLGCGVDVCYPITNEELYSRLCKGESGGGMISEFLPGELPRRGNFPKRNRIVSGLCDVLIVVEAMEKSGTLITVQSALEQGRDIYIVPGRISDPLSYGCNRLIYQGANPIYDIGVFIQELRNMEVMLLEKRTQKQIYARLWDNKNRHVTENGKDEQTISIDINDEDEMKNVRKVMLTKALDKSMKENETKSDIMMSNRENAKKYLTEEEFKIYECLDITYTSIEDIMQKYEKKNKKAISVADVISALTALDYKGFAENDNTFYRRRLKPINVSLF